MRKFAKLSALLGVALLAVSACGGGGGTGTGVGMKNFVAPPVRVKGQIAAVGGASPEGCVLTAYNARSNEKIRQFDVARNFSVTFATGAVFDGLRFEATCEGYGLAHRSKIYSPDEVSARDFKVNLGEMVVRTGLVYVSGRVVNESGKTPKGCSVGIYKAGVKEPLRIWPAPGEYKGEFNITEAGNFFTFEATCPGYSKRGNSGVYGPDMIDGASPAVRTRDLVVQR